MAGGADRSFSDVAKDLGIHANVLVRWCREQERGARAFRGQDVARDGEVARLKRELTRVKQERVFFKDTVVFFARNTPGGMP